MITTRSAPRTRRLLVAAFALSIVVHLFGGALWAHVTHTIAAIMHRLPEQHPPEQEVATSDVITLEKRTVPRPAQRSRPRAQPRMPVRKPAPLAVARHPAPAARPELAHLAVRAPLAPPKPARAPVSGGAAAPPAHRRAMPLRHSALSPRELAQLNAQFAQTIAASHVDLATIQKRSEERPVASQHYPLQFTGVQAKLQRGEGYISPTTPARRVGNVVWYYTHYTYMWPDGHIEDDDIPWPFRFPAQRDLFALGVHLIPLQLPPPGFQLDRPLKPFLAHFLASNGIG